MLPWLKSEHAFAQQHICIDQQVDQLLHALTIQMTRAEAARELESRR